MSETERLSTDVVQAVLDASRPPYRDRAQIAMENLAADLLDARQQNEHLRDELDQAVRSGQSMLERTMSERNDARQQLAAIDAALGVAGSTHEHDRPALVKAWRDETLRLREQLEAERAKVVELLQYTDDAKAECPDRYTGQPLAESIRDIREERDGLRDVVVLAEGQRQRAEAAERALSDLRGRIEGLAKELEEKCEASAQAAVRMGMGGEHERGREDGFRKSATLARDLLADAPAPEPQEPRICVCGVIESDAAWEKGGRSCPECRRVWPESLRRQEPGRPDPLMGAMRRIRSRVGGPRPQEPTPAVGVMEQDDMGGADG